MTTSQTSSFLSEILGGERISVGKRAYFSARLSNEIHAVVLEKFAELCEQGQINKKKLAERIGRSPEQITRWLSGPGNWTLETLSDLLLGMKCEPSIEVRSLKAVTKQDVSISASALGAKESNVFELPTSSSVNGVRITKMNSTGSSPRAYCG